MEEMTNKERVILYAEDEYYNYLLVVKMLKKLNIKVIHVENGQDAVAEIVRNPDIQMVLMDIKMSGMDGVAATREIKKIRPEMPIVAVTAFALWGDRERIMEAGCDDYVVKPLKWEVLLGIIEKFLLKTE